MGREEVGEGGPPGGKRADVGTDDVGAIFAIEERAFFRLALNSSGVVSSTDEREREGELILSKHVVYLLPRTDQ